MTFLEYKQRVCNHICDKTHFTYLEMYKVLDELDPILRQHFNYATPTSTVADHYVKEAYYRNYAANVMFADVAGFYTPVAFA